MRRRRVRSLFLYWLAGIVVAILSQGGVGFENLTLEILVCGISVFVLANVHWHLLPKMRRWPFVATVPLIALIYIGVVVGAIIISILLVVSLATLSLDKAFLTLQQFFATNWRALRYPIEIAVLISVVSELGRRIGPPRIWDLIRGRYRDPREETRVFLLIDLRGSTPLAESLGALRFSCLLRDIFDDLTEPVMETRGDVVGYVGDEAIVSWPVDRGLADANGLRCFQLFKRRIASRAEEYRRQYGVVPTFRAALHAGPIVATEVGQIRTDVALHGDALNTAARVLAECNDLGAELLMSDTVASRVSNVEGLVIEPLGEFRLRGKGEAVALSRAAFRDDNLITDN